MRRKKRGFKIDFSQWPVRPAEDSLSFGWEDYGRARQDATKSCFGKAYAHLYTMKYGGRVANYHENNGLRTIGKREQKKFQPDVIKPMKRGTHYIEVKANSFRRGGFGLAVHQLENYCGVVLQQGLEEQNVPAVDYAFFRHGDRNDTKILHGEVGASSPEKDQLQLTKRIATQTKDLLVVPLNLLIFLLSHGNYHRVEIRNQEKYRSGPQTYFSLKSGVVSILHDEHRGINNLMQTPKVRNLSELIEKLGIEALKVQRTEFPKGITVNGREVKPFPVTRFYMSPKDEKAWFKIFQQHHVEMLTEWLEIDDLFGEVDAVVSPF